MKERFIVVAALIVFTMMVHPQRRGYTSLMSAGRGYWFRSLRQSVNA